MSIKNEIKIFPGRLAANFLLTPAVYICWYFFLLKTPNISVQSDLLYSIAFWSCSFIFTVCLFSIIYYILTDKKKLETSSLKIQHLNLLWNSILSISFWASIFYWERFAFSSFSFGKIVQSISVFTVFLSFVFGSIQGVVSQTSLWLTAWIIKKSKN